MLGYYIKNNRLRGLSFISIITKVINVLILVM
jgi:hypothetical protein